jgi:hypothetical protein
MSTLLAVPPKLTKIRQALFNAAAPIFVNETQWDTYFPDMDNAWSLHKTLRETRQGLNTFYFHCRFVRKTHEPQWKPESPSPYRKLSAGPPPKP